MKGFFAFAVWGVLFALIPFIVDRATRRQFPVHHSGAVIVTGRSFCVSCPSSFTHPST